jgi:[protein-PII] uridylyltransferase
MNSDAYLSVFGPDEIAAHVRESARLNTVATELRHHGAHTDVTVIARDAPFILSRFCAVLSANDANIFDANVFTRDDGIIIDRFRVSSAFNRRQLDPAACAKIEAEMRKIVDGQLDIEQLFREHHRKWKRRTRTSANPNIRTDVEFEDTPRYTIIDVYAPDSVGFLYRVTESISQSGLHIYFAKIATRVDGIVDAFYVLDQSGQPVHDPVRRAAIRDRILGTITSTTELAPA